MKKIPSIVKQIQKFKPSPINFSFQKPISYSQFSIFHQCPYRWSLQYRDGHKIFTSNLSTVFGKAIHQTVQHYLTVLFEQNAVTADREDLISIFEDSLREEYKTQYKNNNNQHFSSPDELREAFDDGVAILNALKRKRSKYFGKRGWWLVGCEVPLILTPNRNYQNVLYQGFLDVVLYHEPTKTFKIIDIKTSYSSWNDKQKKDENKLYQLIFYKKFFAEQFNVPIENIEVEFFILKRKIWEESEFPQSRIQIFSPASGKSKVSKASILFDEFIKTAFNQDGYSEVELKPNVCEKSCKWCPFYKDVLCPESLL